MKDLKYTTQQYVSLDGQKSGCSLGCMGIGCVGVFMLILMMCGGGFYGLLYSSLPLKAIEAMIEQEEDIEIDGLTGNLSSGFSIEELRFKTDRDSEQWSNLTDIKFKYANKNSWFGSDRIIIEELSVDGGTIYAEWDPDSNELDLDPNFEDELEEIGDEFEDIQEEIESEFNKEIGGLKEVRVNLVRVANLKIVNPKTGLELTLDEIKFDGFQWLDGKLVSFGELLVRSNQMQLDTVPSIHFAELKSSQRFEGTIRSQLDRRLKADVDFAVDFALAAGKFRFQGNVFGDAVRFEKSDELNLLEFVDFTPIDFIKVSSDEILPSNLNFEIDYGSNFENEPVKVTETGTFRLGLVQFGQLDLKKNSELDKTTIAGKANVDGSEITAEVYLDDHSPFWITVLSGGEFGSKQELWAQTVFGKSFEELNDERKAAVTKMASERKRAQPVENKANANDKARSEEIDKIVDEVLEKVVKETDPSKIDE